MDYENLKNRAQKSTEKYEHALWKIATELRHIRAHLTLLVVVAWILFFTIMGWHMGHLQ